MRTHELQRSEHLRREPADQNRGEPNKAVGLDELVQVDTQKLSHDTQVTPKVKVFRHPNQVVLVLGVPFDQLLEDLDLDQGLMVETLLVADNLDSDRFARLVVSALNDLPERALAKDPNDFVSIREVIVRNNQVITPLIIVSVIVERHVCPRRILLTLGTPVVNFRKVENLLALIVGQGGKLLLNEA